MPEFTNSYFYKVYGQLFGNHPKESFWHFQWLSGYQLHRDLKNNLKDFGGRVLDVGCGEKPYRDWCKSGEYIGCDIKPGKYVDFIVADGHVLPWESGYFDYCLCTQVMEHVKNPELLLQEIARCLKTEGKLLITLPFIYHEHGSPFDFRRFSQHGMRLFLKKDFEVVEVKVQGGIGSTLGALFLHWLAWFVVGSNKFIRPFLMFFFILISPFVNLVGFSLDKIDKTGLFYNNVLALVRKKS